MKRFIFRKPFVTPADRSWARTAIECANILIDSAQTMISPDGTVTKEGAKLTYEALRLMDMSAKRLGFRNIKDMNEYYKRHGKL